MSDINVFLTTFNTNLRGSEVSDEDLKDWLLPVVDQDEGAPRLLPDIFVIAVQELLPLHWALAGLSGTTLSCLSSRFQTLLSEHPAIRPGSSDSYQLLCQSSHAGIALWVYGRGSTMRARLGKVQTSQLGIGFPPLGMGNKGAVGARLYLDRGDSKPSWETFTFVSAHLEAHDRNIHKRNENYKDIQGNLLFSSNETLERDSPMHETSHLFILGDLNYRLHHLPQAGVYPDSLSDASSHMWDQRDAFVSLDTLQAEQKSGRAFGGLREGDLRAFSPTYKRINGSVQGYSRKRLPGYTDRILLASHNDPSQEDFATTPDVTEIQLYSSSETITLSDHKPVYAAVRLPYTGAGGLSPHLAPKLRNPPTPHPQSPPATDAVNLLLRKGIGLFADRTVGMIWCSLCVLGGGDARMGAICVAVCAVGWAVWQRHLAL